MLQKSTLQFLKNLKSNNDRNWFEAHRTEFEKAKIDFEEFIHQVITDLSKVNPPIGKLLPKDCIFRIYRDVRFSKDKAPYKPHFSASINQGGKKSNLSGIYVHIEPTGGWGNFIGGGVWSPEPENLRKIRQEIEYNHEEFFKIIHKKKFKDLFGDLSQEYKLKRLPKGLEPGHPAEEYLKLNSFIVTCTIPAKDITTAQLRKSIVNAYKTMMPLLNFINRAVE
jgi:uncharacterized protein (TIGR02453 family)